MQVGMPGKHYAAVIGHPVGHSLSPRIHRAAAEFVGLKEEYVACDILPGDLENFVLRLRKEEQWRGLSVTMPYKRSMVNFIDAASEEVGRLSLLNTVVINKGRWEGHNTDITGIVRTLDWGSGSSSEGALLSRTDSKDGFRALHRGALGARWFVLGAGATALSAVKAAGILQAEQIAFAVRDPARAYEAAAYAEESDLGVVGVRNINRKESFSRIQDFSVIISTLPPGAADSFADALQDHKPDLSGTVLLDVAYDPWPSKLALAARSLGATVMDGKYMLLFQAIEQIRLFFPEEMQFYGHDCVQTMNFETYVADAIGVELVKK